MNMTCGGLSVAWPDELPLQVRLIDRLLGQLSDSTRDLVEPQLVHEYLQMVARYYGFGMAYGDVEVDSIPPNLVGWALLVASGELPTPKKRVGAPPTPGRMRNLKILSVVTHLLDELRYTKAKASRLIAKVIDRDVETIKTALDNAEKDYRTRAGTLVINALVLQRRLPW